MTTVKEAHVFRQVDSDSTPIVYSDSQGVVALSKNPVRHNASKHIDVRYHFVRDYAISGKISLEKKPTADNVADGMTKYDSSYKGLILIPSALDGRNEESV